ncbi:MAG: SMC family ATPase [Chloroflexi bacterium]|nr:SMC family ATPase [Chloroflexota bacterium]
MTFARPGDYSVIPLKLSVKNFLSYRDGAPVLDLEGMHVACLCGDNGHGKSALLDAITWALWGQARAPTQAELVYQGESEMRVDLEFQAGEARYRVVRRFARPGRGRQGTTVLELFYASGDRFQPITGNSVRETEARIRYLLRMDYDTFVNSAFILQGRADMFTTSTPARRKELLGEILGLSWYDRLTERARAQGRERETSVRLLETEMSNIDKELSHKEEYQDRLKSIEEDLEAVQGEVAHRERELERLQQEAQRLQHLQEELSRLAGEEERYLKEARERESRISQQQARLEELRARAEKLPTLVGQLASAREALEQADVSHPEQEQQQSRAQELEAQAHHLREVNATLRVEMEDLRTKVDLLKDVGSAARCPLCGQELGEEGCQHLASTYESEGMQKVAAYRENEASVRQLESQVAGLKKEIQQQEGDALRLKRDAQKRHDTLVHQVEEARASGVMIAPLASSLESEESLLKGSRGELERVRAAIPPLKEAVASLPSLQAQGQQAREQLHGLRARQQSLLQELGAVQRGLERCRELEGQRVDKGKALESAAHQKGVFDQLATAFGKGGIQALLIEQAIPELEEYANDLLGRITEHRMSVKLETQRERRSGGDPRETLDIRISDELGTRSYETYSGGEAFRINFALRIALSRLLAYRAGAPLPTLFIDEGFGTQDTAGLERLVEAINVIQSDFQKIIVITHIEELKEAFPVRIEVIKTNQGSTFTVS